jgi:hypothetical protein
MLNLPCLIVSVCLAAQPAAGEETKPEASSGRDGFGVTMLYPSVAGSRPWTAAHWSDHNYVIDSRRDPRDPQGISGKRGDGVLTVEDGVLTMSGEAPRLYVYPYEGTTWRNTEVTVYYMRVSDSATRYAGMVAGVRSGPDGHTDANPCDAHTYYGRMRHDGEFDFAKELKHPSSAPRQSIPPQPAWPNGTLPRHQWIGFKLVAYNIGQTVKLEVYRDLTEGRDGGTWEKVNETLDDGGWFARTDCPEHHPVNRRSDLRILAGGTILIRNTDVEAARYRWLSIREIAPPNG